MEIKLLDMTNQLFISEYNSRVEYSDQFAFTQRSNESPRAGTCKAVWRCALPGGFYCYSFEIMPSAAEPDSPAGGWSCSLS